MKTWFEFSSSHSANVSVIGTFDSNEKAKDAINIVEDITLASWEERFSSIREFEDKWKDKYPYLPYKVSESDMESGVDNTPDIEIVDDKIKISRFRSDNIGGIIKILMMTGAIKIDVTP